MPIWVIAWLLGTSIGLVRYEVRIHHHPATPPPVTTRTQAEQVAACLQVASVAAGSPGTLDCAGR